MKTMLMLCLMILITTPLSTWAAPQIGTIVHSKGSVQILTKPRQVSGNRSPEVLYEGLYFKREQARLGSKVSAGDVLQTGPEGQAKIIFKNGDQLSIGQGTSYRLLGKNKGDAKSSSGVLDVFYGKVRAIISKKGPRKDLKVKAQGTVAGVRGTDFYVFSHPYGSKITVLRGQVEVAKSDDASKTQLVNSGFTAHIHAAKKSTHTADDIELFETPKSELLEIQKISTIDGPADIHTLNKDQQQEVRILENRARKAVLVDIKSTNPEIFEQVRTAKTTKAINAAVVSILYKKAPSAKGKNKPSAEDLKGMGDVYKKYFEE